MKMVTVLAHDEEPVSQYRTDHNSIRFTTVSVGLVFCSGQVVFAVMNCLRFGTTHDISALSVMHITTSRTAASQIVVHAPHQGETVCMGEGGVCAHVVGGKPCHQHNIPALDKQARPVVQLKLKPPQLNINTMWQFSLQLRTCCGIACTAVLCHKPLETVSLDTVYLTPLTRHQYSSDFCFWSWINPQATVPRLLRPTSSTDLSMKKD